MLKPVIEIGQMDWRITLQTLSTANSASGHETVTYSTLAEVWAKVEYKITSTDETAIANKKTAVNRTVFTIRNEYQAQLNEKCRVVYNSTNYDIVSISLSPDKFFMILETEKRV